MSNYLCRIQAGKIKPLIGPMRESAVVDLIQMLGTIEQQTAYCNYSRYGFAKDKLYPNTKAGNQALLSDIQTNAPLLAEFDHLTRRFYVECYYPGGSMPIHTETIKAADPETATLKMEGIMRYRVSKEDLPTLRYFAEILLPTVV